VNRTLTEDQEILKMKTKDLLIIALVIVNVGLAVVLFSQQTQPQQVAPSNSLANLLGQSAVAGPVSTHAGYYRACTIRLAGNREGVAIIDTVTNRLLFFQRPAGARTWELPPTSLNLARDFGHPRTP
jgi:hypothetical protein